MKVITGLVAAAAALSLGMAAAKAEMPVVPPYEAPPEGQYENSFAAGTKVLTDSGLRNIEDIRDGDVVVSFDIDTQRVVNQRVRGVNSRVENVIYEMGIGGQTIRVTRDHPFLTTNGWKRVVETSVGSTVVAHGGGQHTIETCFMRRGSFTVYNFTVEITGTYYVSDLRLLAH
ncbi:MAG: polymorphic toxin-type HINT domain-containing protein [Alphaproteobacteria bacterium]